MTITTALTTLASAVRAEQQAAPRIVSLGRLRQDPALPVVLAVEIISAEEAAAVHEALTGQPPATDWRRW